MTSLSTSSSVSGMNLYIPPYAQPAREPSPAPSASTTMQHMAPSNSFAQLGLPSSHSHHRNQSLPVSMGFLKLDVAYDPDITWSTRISTIAILHGIDLNSSAYPVRPDGRSHSAYVIHVNLLFLLSTPPTERNTSTRTTAATWTVLSTYT